MAIFDVGEGEEVQGESGAGCALGGFNPGGLGAVRGAKSGPRAAQERGKSVQERPRALQDRSKRV